MAKKNDIELKEKKPNMLDAFIDKVVEDSDVEKMQDIHQNPVVTTGIPSYNRASVIGGISSGGTYSLCGDQASGKSTFAILACAAFQSAGYPSLYLDSEATADKKWFSTLGVDLDRVTRIVPKSIQHASRECDKFINKYSEFKEKDPQWTALIVLDSYNKLRPEEDMENTIIDDMQMPRHANFMTQWFNKLTPKLYSLDIAFLVVRHYRMNLEKKNKYDKANIVSGAMSVSYENSMSIVFSKGEAVKEEQDKKDVIIGNWHNFYIEKNKDGINGQQGKFFISKGLGSIPIGYDEYGTAVEEAIYQGIIKNVSNRFVFELSDQRYTHDELRPAVIADKKLYQGLLKLLNTYWERENVEKSKSV